MGKFLGSVAVFLTTCVSAVLCGYYCTLNDSHWYCSFDCCFDYTGCCYNYWYAWTIGSVIFLFCLCVCAGCGGYGYRRHYVVRTYQAPPNHATVVTTTTARTGYYQPQPTSYQTVPPPAYR